MQASVRTSLARRTVGCWRMTLSFIQHSAANSALLDGRSLDAIVNMVFTGDGGRLLVADVAVKTFEFRIAAVHAPCSAAERHPFFRRMGSFLDVSKRTVLVGDWNAILDPKIDRAGRDG